MHDFWEHFAEWSQNASQNLGPDLEPSYRHNTVRDGSTVPELVPETDPPLGGSLRFFNFSLQGR